MKKLNGHDQFVIEQALELWVAQFEKEITEAEAKGHRTMFDIKFPAMAANELKSKIASLTRKK
jgi:hypothetical protein